MSNELSGAELDRALYWEYLPEWCAWWLMVPSDGLTAQRGFGPFNATEAVWAGEVHGVPFREYVAETVGGSA